MPVGDPRLAGAAVDGAHGVGDAADLAVDRFLVLPVQAPHRAAETAAGGDHVQALRRAGADEADGDGVGPGGVQPVGDDPLDGRRDVPQDGHGIDRFLGDARVAAPALDGDHEVAGPQRGVAGRDDDAARLAVAAVQREDHVHALARAFPHQSGGAARERLLPGLKAEADRALRQKAGPGGQDLGQAQQHGDVDVVAAGVHHAVTAGPVSPLGRLLQGQGVHVGAEEDHGAGTPAVQPGDHGVPGKAGLDGQTEAFQLLPDEARGVRLPEGQLRVFVQMVPVCQQAAFLFPGESPDLISGHGAPLLSYVGYGADYSRKREGKQGRPGSRRLRRPAEMWYTGKNARKRDREVPL